MGAWIEIYPFIYRIISVYVAPLVGAWIEIEMHSSSGNRYPVAPLVGAWIEIRETFLVSALVLSLPSWERGLKYLHLVKT